MVINSAHECRSDVVKAAVVRSDKGDSGSEGRVM